jgi:hypothetical protein
MRSLGQTAEFDRVLIVEDHVHAAGFVTHGRRLHASARFV